MSGTQLTIDEIAEFLANNSHLSRDQQILELRKYESAKLSKQISVSHWGIYGPETD